MSTEQNKSLIEKYNKEVIEKCNMQLLREIASQEFINHSAPNGMDAGIDGMEYFFTNILHTSFTDIKVSIEDMVADDYKIATRKTIYGIHNGKLMDIAPTGKEIAIHVIDIFSVENGKISAHWGQNNFTEVIQSL